MLSSLDELITVMMFKETDVRVSLLAFLPEADGISSAAQHYFLKGFQSQDLR